MSMPAAQEPSQFAQEIRPFFGQRRICYFDVGAHKGLVLQDLVDAGIAFHQCHMFEPRQAMHGMLNEVLSQIGGCKLGIVHPVAVSDSGGEVTLLDQDDMSRILSGSEVGSSRIGAPLVQVPSVGLDDVCGELGIDRIDLLKIDVEGHEIQVLESARGLLASGRIDVIRVEAGFSCHSVQQTPFFALDEFMSKFGYRLFRIYEQTPEWIDDSPLLRRVDAVYMTETFAARHPLSLLRSQEASCAEVADLRGELSLRDARVASLDAEVADLRGELSLRDARVASLDAEVADLRGELSSRDSYLSGLHEDISQFIENHRALLLAGADAAEREKHLRVELARATAKVGEVTDFLEIKRRVASTLEGTGIPSDPIDESVQILLSRVVDLDATLTQVLSSRSWRYTRWLRVDSRGERPDVEPAR
ncbi:MAG: FkbM family methyltransferase [Candidatus Nanopelagicales bacterium]